MDISWFQLLSANVQELSIQTMSSQTQEVGLAIEQLKPLLSANADSHATINSLIFIVYVFVSLLIKRPSVLMAFFVSWMVFELSIFDPLSEASLYLLTFAIYSYVITCNALTFKQRIACGILLTLSIILAYDAYFYGIDGIYGAHKTVVYNHIEYLALCAHTIFIGTLIPYRRIKNGIRHFLASLLYQQGNSAYMLFSV